MMPALVKLFECEATRKQWRGVSAVPRSRSADPKACSRTSLPWSATAMTQPGCSDSRIWNSIQRGMESRAAGSHFCIVRCSRAGVDRLCPHRLAGEEILEALARVAGGEIGRPRLVLEVVAAA